MSRVLLILIGFPVAVALKGVAAEGDRGTAATPRAADATLVLNESAYFRQHLVFGLERLSAKPLKEDAEKQPWKIAGNCDWLVAEPGSGEIAPGSSVRVRITARPGDREGAVHEPTLTLRPRAERSRKNTGSGST